MTVFGDRQRLHFLFLLHANLRGLRPRRRAVVVERVHKPQRSLKTGSLGWEPFRAPHSPALEVLHKAVYDDLFR